MNRKNRPHIAPVIASLTPLRDFDRHKTRNANR
jgi:hypothetical protein